MPRQKGKDLGRWMAYKDQWLTVNRAIVEHYLQLTSEQQDYIAEKYYNAKITNTFSLTKETLKRDDIDNHGPEVTAVRKFITRLDKLRPFIELTPEQQKFVYENGERMKPYEIARAIFNKMVGPSHLESRTIEKYAEAINRCYRVNTEEKLLEAMEDGKFRTPSTISKIIDLVNESQFLADYPKQNLTKEQKRNLNSLKGYLCSPRFTSTINQIKDPEQKALFQGEFVRAVYNKPDLNSEQLNMYISLVNEYIHELNIQKLLDIINQDMELEVSGDEENRKMRMTLVEASGKKISELDNCRKRQKGLQEALAGARASMMKEKADSSKTLVAFVEKWKDEDNRKHALMMAKARKEKLREEKGKLASYEGYLAEIWGIDDEDIGIEI